MYTYRIRDNDSVSKWINIGILTIFKVAPLPICDRLVLRGLQEYKLMAMSSLGTCVYTVDKFNGRTFSSISDTLNKS